MGEHSYKPLDASTSEIRLLVLSPSSASGHVHARLVITLIAQAPTFEAISYRWNTHGEATISIDDSSRTVSQGVFDMLRSLQAYDKERTLWIDALCINQADLAERASQVKLMTQIYSSAERVIGWVVDNPRPPAMPATFAGLRTVAEALRSRRIKLDSGEPLEPITEDLDTLLYSVASFYKNEFFIRIWIIQELSLAQEVVLRLGDEEIAWTPFVQMTQSLDQLVDQRQSLFDDVRYGIWPLLLGVVTSIGRVDCIREALADTNGVPLHELIRFSHGFDCTDPRDRIFGLLGLSTMRTRESLRVDYDNLTTADVSAEATRYMLKEEASFTNLELAGIGYVEGLDETSLEQPSWTPNWEHRSIGVAFNARRFLHPGQPRSKPVVTFAEGDSKSIVLQGQIVDKVEVLSPIIGRDKTAGGVVSDVIWLRVLANEYKSEMMTVDNDNPLWKMLFFGKPVEPDQENEDFEAWMARFEAALLLMKQDPEASAELANSFDASYWQLVFVLLPITDRKICYTERGFFGNVPPYAQEGDFVVSFAGASCPFVLRPLHDSDPDGETTYLNVGMCYIDSIVPGELAGPKSEWGMITLR